MSTLRISDAPLLPDVNGTEKIPTGGRGDYAVTIDQLKTFAQGGVPQQLQEFMSQKGQPSGLATLDDSGKVPRSELYDFVDLNTTIPTYTTTADGVDTVTGVPDGSYFNVRSSDDELYTDEYQNVGGSPVATGKSYLSALGVQQQDKPTNTIKDANGKNQQEINYLNFDLLSSADLADYYTVRKVLGCYIKKSSQTSFEILYLYENSRAVQYGFTTDQDGLTRLTSAKIGKSQVTETGGNVTQVTLNGSFIDSGGNNWRTETVGNSFSGSFTGTGFKFSSRRDNRGGLWRFVIDGAITKDISVYSATTIDSSDPSTAIPVVNGLEYKEHSFVATFMGDDPSNPPSSSPSRGWLKYNAVTAVTIPTLTNAITLMPSDNLKSPNLPIVGTGSGVNYYTTTVGDSMSFSFTGTGFAFNHYADNRGGLWRFVIDGNTTKDISTYGVGGNRKTEVITGLSNTEHTVVMTFLGQDPANPATTPRGWYDYSSAEPRTFEIYPRTPKQTEEMLAVSSVLEYAISTRPESQPTMEATWTPIHSGRSGVSRNITKKINVNGIDYTSLDVAITNSSYQPVQVFKIQQTFRTFNANDIAGNYPIFDVVLSHEINNRGSILHKQQFKAINDVRVMDGYVSMLGARTIVDEIESSSFESYKVSESGSRVQYDRTPTGMSMKFTPDKYVFVTQSKTPLDSYNLKGKSNPISFTNIRSDAIKSYMQGFKTDSVFVKDSEIQNVIEYLLTEY